ncbi:MAG: hypothetical protein IOD12_03675 [Silvanigrellales bacterium]|nr:hypothetical protein [Silvanigrellales bacterium]
MKRRLSTRTELVPASQLSEAQKKSMFRVFERYYQHVSYELFRADLADKQSVFLFLRDGLGGPRIVGFSTNWKRTLWLSNGRTATFLFSGDTVLEKDHWGTKILQMAFFWYILRCKLASPFSPVYWMLISKGYKTYLMMRRNFPRSFPSPVDSVDIATRRVIDEFYGAKFGDAYKPDSGLIVFDTPHGAVKEGIAAPTPELQGDADVAFFLQTNARYQEGVELACLAEIRFSDFPRHVLKYFIRPLFSKKLFLLAFLKRSNV